MLAITHLRWVIPSALVLALPWVLTEVEVWD
jgi:hypothetical protein